MMKRASTGLVVQSALDAPSFRVLLMQRVLLLLYERAHATLSPSNASIFAVYPSALAPQSKNHRINLLLI